MTLTDESLESETPPLASLGPIAVTGDAQLAERVARTLRGHGYGAERSLEARADNEAVVLCCAGNPVIGVPKHAHERPTVVVGHEDSPCRCCGSALASFAEAWVPQQLLEVQLPMVLAGIIRRARGIADARVRRVRLNRESSTVWIDSTPVRLRRTPFEVLAYLVSKRGDWVTQETMLREVFGARRSYDTALVRVHVHALRRALGEQARCLESRRGCGYRFAPGLFDD